MKFRTLRPDEIECRVGQINDKGFTLLLYKDARCDMNILDETVGPMNWRREHTRDNANCVVSLWDNDKRMWVPKEDTGAESNQDAEKGLASDSFKRACVNWGIGRELYTAPFIYVKGHTRKNTKGKDVPALKKIEIFDIDYNENKVITKLIIKGDGETIYSFDANVVAGKKPGSDAETQPEAEDRKKPKISKYSQVQELIKGSLFDLEDVNDWIKNTYNTVIKINDLSEEQFEKLINTLRKNINPKA